MSDVVLPGTGGELSTGFMCAEFPGISDISYLAIFVATQMESNFIGDRLTNTSRPSPGRRPPPAYVNAGSRWAPTAPTIMPVTVDRRVQKIRFFSTAY